MFAEVPFFDNPIWVYLLWALLGLAALFILVPLLITILGLWRIRVEKEQMEDAIAHDNFPINLALYDCLQEMGFVPLGLVRCRYYLWVIPSLFRSSYRVFGADAAPWYAVVWR